MRRSDHHALRFNARRIVDEGAGCCDDCRSDSSEVTTHDRDFPVVQFQNYGPGQQRVVDGLALALKVHSEAAHLKAKGGC